MFNHMMRLDATTKQLFLDPAKRRAWVIYQLNLRGKSLASLAREYQLERTAPGQALRSPYPRMERAIAEAVDVPVHELFPDRYSPNGERLIRMGRPKKSIHMQPKNNTPSKGRNGKDRDVA